MILSDTTIRELDLIAPFSERNKQNGMSYGVGPASYDIRSNEKTIIAPKSYAMVASVEYVKLPNDVAAMALVKSTWMRSGLLVGNGWFDPGFEGFATIMLVNHSDKPVTIKALDPIAQLVFWRTDMKVSAPYAGKYQGQGAKPVGPVFVGEGVEFRGFELVKTAADEDDMRFTRDDDAA